MVRCPVGVKSADDGPIPLLPGQVSFFEQQYELLANPHELNMALTLDFVAQDLDHVINAVQRVWLMHPELDVCFVREGNNWLQQYRDSDPSVLVADLGAVPDDLRQRYADTLTTKLHGTLDIHQGPMVQFLIVKDDESLSVVAVVHHLVTDGLGMTLLAQHLTSTIESTFESPLPNPHPARCAHRRAIASVLDYAHSEVILAELPGWLRLRTVSLAQLPARDDVRQPGRATVHHVKYFDYVLPTGDYDRLASGPWTRGSQGFNIDTILLASLGYALTRTYHQEVLVEVQHNGRTYVASHPGASLPTSSDLVLGSEAQTSAGFLSVKGGLILPLYDSQPPGEYVDLVDKRRRERVNFGTSWGLLRFLSAKAEMSGLLADPACVPQVSYNHVGVGDGGIEGPTGRWVQRLDQVNPLYVERHPEHPMPSDGWVTPLQLAVTSSGRSVRCSLVYFSSLYSDDAVRSLATQLGLFLSECVNSS